MLIVAYMQVFSFKTLPLILVSLVIWQRGWPAMLRPPTTKLTSVLTCAGCPPSAVTHGDARGFNKLKVSSQSRNESPLLKKELRCAPATEGRMETRPVTDTHTHTNRHTNTLQYASTHTHTHRINAHTTQHSRPNTRTVK